VESQTTSQWWRQFEADADALERSIERQHLAAIDADQPWPPERHPRAAGQTETTPVNERALTEPAADHDETAARITTAITSVEDAARRISAEQADRHARSEYAARLSREAQAQPEAAAEVRAGLDAQALDEAEIEM